MNYRIIPALLLFGFCLISCDGKEHGPEAAEEKQQKQAVAPAPETTVLARVNGEAITRADVDSALKKLVGEKVAADVDDKTRKKILDSMVTSRAISQSSLAELSADEKRELERDVAAFREQQLVRRYIARHGKPEPVSMEMIQAYYDTHADRFGGSVVKEYEMIACTRKLPNTERDGLLELFSSPQSHDDWHLWVQQLSEDGYPVSYRRAEDGSVLHLRLQEALAQMTKASPPRLVMVNEVPYLLRVIAEKKVAARELSEVSGEIEKILAPAQVKKTVEAIGNEVLEDATVEYL